MSIGAPHSDTVAVPAGRLSPTRTGPPLARIHPLAKIAGTLPVMLVLLLVRDAATLAAFVMVTAAGLVAGTRPAARRVLLRAGAGAAAAAWFAVVLGLAADPAVVAGTPVLARLGPVMLSAGGLESGAASALRIAALVLLAALGAAATDGTDLVRALVNGLAVPYRYGYAALAALRFVPRFRHELSVIRTAQRVRGVVEPPGPRGAARRARRNAVPLLAGGIRHAERVALAMDARGFGAHTRRTDRHPWRLGPRDAALTVACWALAAVIISGSGALGLLRLYLSVRL